MSALNLNLKFVFLVDYTFYVQSVQCSHTSHKKIFFPPQENVVTCIENERKAITESIMNTRLDIKVE